MFRAALPVRYNFFEIIKFIKLKINKIKNYSMTTTSAGGRSKNMGGPALKNLDRLERLVTILNPGKSGGATAPLALGSGGPGEVTLESLINVVSRIIVLLKRAFLPIHNLLSLLGL